MDVENWDGESAGKDAKFVFGSKPKPLPEFDAADFEVEDGKVHRSPSEEAKVSVASAAAGDVPEEDAAGDGISSEEQSED